MNYGSSGVSFNIGVPGASITVGSKGVYANMGVPGTGIRNRKKIDATSEKTTDSDNNAPQITERRLPTFSASPMMWTCLLFSATGAGL